MKSSSDHALFAAAGALILASLAARPIARASDPAAPDAGPLPAASGAEPFGDTTTPRPDAAEWKSSKPVSVSGELPRDCRSHRVREWVKIHCSPRETASIALLGGKRDDVLLFLVPPFHGGVPEGGDVIFPVRRGDRRVFEWSAFGGGYDGLGSPEVDLVISESWAPADPGPVIVAHSARVTEP